MKINAYLTSTLSAIDKKPVVDALLKYYVSVYRDINLAYEYSLANVVFITGRSEEERMLPKFDIPHIGTTFKGEKVVFVDLRNHLKPVTEDIIVLESFIKDRIGFELDVTRALIMYELIINPFAINEVQKYMVHKMANMLSNLLFKNFHLDSNEILVCDILCAKFYLDMFLPDDGSSSYDIEEYSSIIFITLRRQYEFDVIKKILGETPNKDSRIEDLINNIKKVSGSNKLSKLDKTIMYNLYMTLWINVQGPINLLTALEHPATFLAMLYMSHKKMLSKSRFHMVCNGGKTRSEDTVMIKFVDNIIENNRAG